MLLASEALQRGSLGTVCFRWRKQEIQGEKSVNDYRHNNWLLSLRSPYARPTLALPVRQAEREPVLRCPLYMNL